MMEDISNTFTTRFERQGLALKITEAFYRGQLDLSLRGKAPVPGWHGMPEVVVVNRLREQGAEEAEIRLLLTFTAAMDRARDADRLWANSLKLFQEEPWAFSPKAILDRGLLELADILRTHGVSQRHSGDAAAWRCIAETLSDSTRSPSVFQVIYSGTGDAVELRQALSATTPHGTPLFPYLSGPKVGPMWIRMLAVPGGVTISSIETIPIAVDVQVRKIGEYLGVTKTKGMGLEMVRNFIQQTWEQDVRQGGSRGPTPLENTSAALDPALWFYAKWGCTFCERAKRRKPISDVCQYCSLG